MYETGQVDQLAQALAQAQGEFEPALKSRTNPHLHNQYATFDDVVAVVREPLSRHGL